MKWDASLSQRCADGVATQCCGSELLARLSDLAYAVAKRAGITAAETFPRALGERINIGLPFATAVARTLTELARRTDRRLADPSTLLGSPEAVPGRYPAVARAAGDSVVALGVFQAVHDALIRAQIPVTEAARQALEEMTAYLAAQQPRPIPQEEDLHMNARVSRDRFLAERRADTDLMSYPEVMAFVNGLDDLPDAALERLLALGQAKLDATGHLDAALEAMTAAANGYLPQTTTITATERDPRAELAERARKIALASRVGFVEALEVAKRSDPHLTERASKFHRRIG